MSIKTKNLRPGDKVRISIDVMYHIDDIAVVVDATKGSVGIVVSYEEYSDFVHKTNQTDCTKHLAWAKLQIEAENLYPIRIEEFIPYEYDGLSSTYAECYLGYISLLSDEWFEKIEPTHSPTK